MGKKTRATGEKMTWGLFLKRYLMLIVLVVLVVFFSFAAKSFFTQQNLTNIILQSSYTIIAGMGICFIMISGGIDLSIGYQMSLVAVLIGIMLKDLLLPTPVVILIALVVGMLLGLLNGALVVKLRVFPMIITLATSSAFQGLSYIISDSRTWLRLPASYLTLGQGYVGPIPVAVIIMVVIVLLVSFILNRTYFGRYVYGIGGNAEAIKLAGVNVDKMRILIYALAGLFVAFGTIIMVSRTGSAASILGVGTEFTCLTAGILGGISFKGGEGKVSGMVIGILILQVLGNGMQLMGMGIYPQYIAKAIVLAAAVGFDSYQKNLKVRTKRPAKETAA